MLKARPVKHVSPSQAVADIIRTTLGPRSMLKMLLDASGGARGAVSAVSSASAGRQQTFAMTAQRGSSPTEAVRHMAISSLLGISRSFNEFTEQPLPVQASSSQMMAMPSCGRSMCHIQQQR